MIVETKGLKKYYGEEPNIVRALDGVDFSVEEGEFVAVGRRAGSGKGRIGTKKRIGGDERFCHSTGCGAEDVEV